MIAEYPLELINNQKDMIKIEGKLVDYSWRDYLSVKNVSDIWKR